jgi:hypothetical protein
LCRTGFDYKESIKGSQWVYEKLAVEFKDKYRVLFYSGDTDGSVPALGSFKWIEEIGWDIK